MQDLDWNKDKLFRVQILSIDEIGATPRFVVAAYACYAWTVPGGVNVEHMKAQARAAFAEEREKRKTDPAYGVTKRMW